MNNVIAVSDGSPSSTSAPQESKPIPWYERIGEFIFRALSQNIPSEAAGSAFGYSVEAVTPSAPSDLKGYDSTSIASSSITGKAPAAPAAIMRPRPEKDYSEGFHYVVKRRGETVADLVGTAHADVEGICRLNPTVEEAAKKADRVAFESMVTKRDLDRLETHRQRSKSTTQKSYQEYKNTHVSDPNFIYDPALSIATEEIKPVDKNRGTENLILKLRGEHTKYAIISLETIEEHAEIGNYPDLIDETLYQRISEGIISEEQWIRAENIALDAYRNGDERRVQISANLLKNLDPSGYYHMYTKRNRLHASRAKPLLEKATADKRVLIAIGAEHLFGEDGVIKLLEQDLGDDYRIERVRGSTSLSRDRDS